MPALLTTAHSATVKKVINFGGRKYSFNEVQIKMVTLVMYQISKHIKIKRL